VGARTLRIDSRTIAPVLGLFALALVVRLVPAWFVYGSDDVLNWQHVAQNIGAKYDPYAAGLLNWPPLWPWVIRLDAKIGSTFGLTWHFAVKLGPIVADSLIGVVLYGAARADGRATREAVKAALWYVLNPVPIFTVALHGQFDSLPALFALLAVVSATHRPGGIASGFWVGLGAFAKTWPVILLPGLLLRGPWARRGWVAYLAVAPVLFSVGAALYLVNPDEISRTVLHYDSAAGWWGLTSWTAWGLHGPFDWLSQHGAIVLYLALIVVWLACYRRATQGQLACAMILTFLVFTPGFGLQYLLWVVPIGLYAEPVWARAYSALATLSLGVLYVFRPFDGIHFGFLAATRSGRFWADYGHLHDRFMSTVVVLPVWLLVIAWLVTLVRRVRAQSDTAQSAVSRSAPAGLEPAQAVG
jgi:hypothetical protein